MTVLDYPFSLVDLDPRNNALHEQLVIRTQSTVSLFTFFFFMTLLGKLSFGHILAETKTVSLENNYLKYLFLFNIMTRCLICKAPLFSTVNIQTYSRLSLFTEIGSFLSSIAVMFFLCSF